jgi:hypothetical protein
MFQAQKSPIKGLIGGQGRNRTGVDGFAGRSITTLPPGLGKESPSICSEARYSTIRCITMPCVDHQKRRLWTRDNKKPGSRLAPRRVLNLGAGNETRTRDPNLGKVVLYQLSYSRFEVPYFKHINVGVNLILPKPLSQSAGGWHNTAT